MFKFKKLLCAVILICLCFSLTTCDILTEVNTVITDDGKLSVHFIDVGQADSIFIKLPTGKTMLIDAGNNIDGEDVVRYIRRQGVDTIDYLIGTHPHADHIGGMDDVIENLNIENIYMPRVTADTMTFEEVLLAIKDKGLKITEVKAGTLVTDETVRAEFVAPCGSYYEELNDYSAVLKLTYGNKTFLFTGDAEELSEREILRKYDVDADVLKVGHHGSNTSSCYEFLKAVSPEIAVISVGENNDYKHPSKKILNRIEKTGATVYRTDLNGNIILICDGENIDVVTEWE